MAMTPFPSTMKAINPLSMKETKPTPSLPRDGPWALATVGVNISNTQQQQQQHPNIGMAEVLSWDIISMVGLQGREKNNIGLATKKRMMKIMRRGRIRILGSWQTKLMVIRVPYY
jgi:hypothetical protein